MKTPKISKTKDNISQMTHQQVMKSMNSHQIIKSMSSKNLLPQSQENIRRSKQINSRNENGSIYLLNKNRTNKSDLNLIDNTIITIDDQDKLLDERYIQGKDLKDQSYLNSEVSRDVSREIKKEVS